MLRRRGRANNPRFGNRKRLLLNCLHVSLQKIIIKSVIDLSRTFEIA